MINNSLTTNKDITTRTFLQIFFFHFKMTIFYGHCPEGIGRHNVEMCICHSVTSHFLGLWLVKIVIVEEVIEVHELDKGNISASLGKQDKQGKAELSCATLGNKPNKKMSPTKFTYSGRICRFGQFFYLLFGCVHNLATSLASYHNTITACGLLDSSYYWEERLLSK